MTLDASTRAQALRSGAWPLVSSAEMRALDQETIEGAGVPGELLMESAGRALIDPILALRAEGEGPTGPILILAAAGNNGGDGFVVARHLAGEGQPVETLLIGDPAKLPREAAANWRRLERIGAKQSVVSPRVAAEQVRAGDAAVLVDALFGTGLSRPLEGDWAELVEAIEAARGAGVKVLAVDTPSGLCADTGAVLGCAVRADATVTIGVPKIGLALEPGAEYAGRVSVARIGILDPSPDRPDAVALWDVRAAARSLPPRPRAGHKGRFGHVLVLAGSTGKGGAGVLAARAAARAGAGLVTFAHPVGLESELAALPVEVMTAPIAATEGGGCGLAGEKAAMELIAARDVVALGPGLGTDPETVAFVQRLLPEIDLPVVLDADGLNAVVGALDVVRNRRSATVLTPHPGEAARLLETTPTEINRDRLAAARRLARDTQAVVLLKGARTVIAAPEGTALVNPTGGPALGAGGTGDVLTGVVAALLAAGVAAFEAAGLAAWWHGATADERAGATGFGLLASELADALPSTAKWMQAAAARAADEEGGPGAFLDLRFPGS